MSVCEVCGDQVATPARGRRPRFCGGTCRVRAYRDPVPGSLKSRARWIRHEAKRPMAVGGWWLSVTDPAGWSTYADAKASRHGDGVGFVLNGDGVVCIDLDDCVTVDGPSAQAVALVEAVGPTYVEYSPSGRGLHVWGFADVARGRRFTLAGLKVEVYPAGRYITVTGDPYRRGELGQLNLDILGLNGFDS
jgi:primase-polymerase (primpol)-like protein